MRLLAQLAFGDTTAIWPQVAEPATLGTDPIQGADDPVPEILCYALLEAARFPGLRETLDGGALDYACLFQGAAAKELGDVAPYLVQLPADHPFTRQLLTPWQAGGPYWHHWGQNGVTLLRSSGSLEDLLRHFRKFTRLFDPARSRWNYFRFYAPETLRGMIAHMNPAPFATFAAPVLFFLTEGRAQEPLLLGQDPQRLQAYLAQSVAAC